MMPCGRGLWRATLWLALVVATRGSSLEPVATKACIDDGVCYEDQTSSELQTPSLVQLTRNVSQALLDVRAAAAAINQPGQEASKPRGSSGGGDLQRRMPSHLHVGAHRHRRAGTAKLKVEPNKPAGADNFADCIGRWETWSACSKTCTRWRTFVHVAPAKGGGKPCNHPDKFQQKSPCTGGQCPHQELAPTGNLPGDEKPEESVHRLAVGVELPFVIAVVASLLVAEMLEHFKPLGFVPHSLTVVVVSGCLGFAMRYFAGEKRWEADDFSPVSSSVMNLVLLPIIIFQSGWSLDVRPFWSNFGYILILAVLGTAISTFCVAGMIIYTGQHGWHVVTGVREAFAVAAFVSATDPVATLATYSSKQVESTLNILVFGESTINDAVAIAFFNLLNADEPTAFFDWHRTFSRAFILLTSSMMLGFMLGAFLTLLYRGIKETGRISTEFAVIFVFASGYFTNGVAESMHCSGIIACLFSGMTMCIYLKPNMVEGAKDATDAYLDTAAKLADLTVFVMVGVTTALIKSPRGCKFGGYLILFCLLGRAASVGICALLGNGIRAFRRQAPLFTVKRTCMIWHAGLRGGIALTLALQLNDWAEHKAVIVVATFCLITIMLVVMGGSTDFMLNVMNVPRLKDEAAAHPHAGGEPLTYADHTAGVLHGFLHPILVGRKDPRQAEALAGQQS